jgi:hypothetical protein
LLVFDKAFTPEELTTGLWVKIGAHGVARLLHLSADGSLAEQDLFAPRQFRTAPIDKYVWEGSWQLEDNGGVLRISVGPWHLAVSPERRFNVHTGVERCDARTTGAISALSTLADRRFW